MFNQKKKEDPEQKFYKKLSSINPSSYVSSLLLETDEHENQVTKFADGSKGTNGSTRLIKPVEEKEVKTPLQQPSKPQPKKKQKEEKTEKTTSTVSSMTDELQEKILADAVARNRSAELINDERERRNKQKQQVQQQTQNQQQEVDNDGWKFEKSVEWENPKLKREIEQSKERAAKRKKQGKKPTKIKFDTSNVDYDHPTIKHPENGSQNDLGGPEL